MFQALRRVRAERHGLSELRRGRTLISTVFVLSYSAMADARWFGQKPPPRSARGGKIKYACAYSEANTASDNYWVVVGSCFWDCF